MADISKCKGTKCPFKEKCHRHTATDSQYQSYLCTPPIHDEGAEPDKCEMFWDNTGYKQVTKPKRKKK